MKYTITSEPVLSTKIKYGTTPEYVFEREKIQISLLRYLYYNFLLYTIKILLKIRFKMWWGYKKYKNNPQHNEVEKIYFREAKAYERKHHLTTNFRDTWWRRQIGLEIINYIHTDEKLQEKIKILDICAGSGLSLEEMFSMFKLFNVKIDAIGLDYNKEMLKQAQKITLPRMLKNKLLEKGRREISFVKGDARNLIQFVDSSFDCITIMFGMGGIDAPIKTMQENLRVLKLNGIFAITDIHKPIIRLQEKWPWFMMGTKNAPAFGLLAWNKITKPLVLASLWGWRDVTPLFYVAPLITKRDEKKNKYYGFKQVSLFLDNEHWWCKIPAITTAKIVLRKTEISKTEFEQRQKILNKIYLK